MRALTQKLKKQRRKQLHIRFLQETITAISNDILRDVISADFQENKKIIICHSRLQNKAKLLKKYNRRMRLLVY
jgi:hypothetical protein|tara:strand:- start:442 stop:663 length:222 start_codon:yes stop_codon:yes gene_type:complete